MQFQPPAPLSLQRQNTIPQSLDSVFDQVLRFKQFQAQQAAAQQQLGAARLQTAPFGFSPEQVSPEAIQQASGGLQDQSRPFDPNNTPMANQNSVQPQLSPLASGIQNYINAQKASMAMGIRKGQAETGKIEAEGAKAAGEAQRSALVNSMLMPGPGGGLIPNTLAAVQAGRITPAQADDWLGRNPDVHLGYTNAAAGSGLNMQSLQNTADRNKSLASGGAIPTANTEALKSSLNVLEKLNREAPRDSIQLINKYGLAIAAQKGDRLANRLLMQSKVASDMFQNNFGAGSNEKLALAASLSDPKQTTQQLADTIQLMRADMTNRVNAYAGRPSTVHPQFEPTPMTRTLKNGTKVNVVQLPNGQYQVVK